jgi:hypothetical protein
MNFEANVSIGRLMASESDETIVGYSADVVIRCVDCNTPFEFVGLPMGYSPMQPMCSVDGTEARMPIMPRGEKMRTDLAGFHIRVIK